MFECEICQQGTLHFDAKSFARFRWFVYFCMERKTRETLREGDTGMFSKTVTEADVLAFAGASGDFNPLHIDEEYARKSVFGRRVAHGILTAAIISTVLGGEIPGLGTVFVELLIRFLKPVFLGDTV